MYDHVFSHDSLEKTFSLIFYNKTKKVIPVDFSQRSPIEPGRLRKSASILPRISPIESGKTRNSEILLDALTV
jgi:hypothetical protein